MSVIRPAVFYRDPTAALSWLESAFGLEVSMLLTDTDGRLAHAEMSWRGEEITIGAEWSAPELLGPASLNSPASLGGAGTQFIHLEIEDGIDAHCERAQAAGARITQAPEDQFYGDRTYRALDLEGHVWTFGQRMQDVTIAEMEQAIGLTFRKGGGR